MVTSFLFNKEQDCVGSLSLPVGDFGYPLIAIETDDESLDVFDENFRERIRGYFFDDIGFDRNFRNVFIESFRYDLANYLPSLVTNQVISLNDWDFLSRSCRDVTRALAHLHKQEIYLDGRLDPSKVFIQPTDGLPVLRIVIPDNHILSHGQSTFSIEWDGHFHPREKDMVSLALILYFIHTCGEKWDDASDHLATDIISNRTAFATRLENLCPSCETNSTEYKYRKWKLGLLGHFLDWMLMEYRRLDSTQLLRHPFFWSPAYILFFIMRSADYVKENIKHKKKISVPDGALESKFKASVDFEALSGYPKTINFLKTSQSPTKPKPVGNESELLTAIRDKCAHWSETAEHVCKARLEAIQELEDLTFATPAESTLDKFSLFWMSMYPKLLSSTWETLIGDDFGTEFPDFFPSLKMNVN